MRVRRREFLGIGGRAALLTLAACASRPSEFFGDHNADGTVEARVAALVQAYDSQGDHRTATEGDIAAATWLVDEARKTGAEGMLESFELLRV